MHIEVKKKISKIHATALKVLLFRLWIGSSPSIRRKIEKMLGLHKKHRSKRSKSHKHKKHKKAHKRKAKRGHKLSKKAARERFFKLLPKINAGRKRKGLPPIRVKR